MQWFEPDILDFFADLEFNNNREWFEKNKKRYEKSVRKPMEALAAELIERVRVIDPSISMAPKDAVFRIHRDIRFSKDKTPYKTNAGLYVSPSGRNHLGAPGVYFHVDARVMGIASGYYAPSPPQVFAIRSHIVENLEEFNSLLEAPDFKNLFTTFSGEKGKILPKEFRSAADVQPIVFNKQFYYWAEFGGMDILREDLPDLIIRHFAAARPMNAFLSTAVHKLVEDGG